MINIKKEPWVFVQIHKKYPNITNLDRNMSRIIKSNTPPPTKGLSDRREFKSPNR